MDDFTRGFITCLLFTTDENEFPEYCYSGEFNPSSDDLERIHPQDHGWSKEVAKQLKARAGYHPINLYRDDKEDDTIYIDGMQSLIK